MGRYWVAERDIQMLQFGERELSVLMEVMATFLRTVAPERAREVVIDRHDIYEDDDEFVGFCWKGRIFLGPES